jgi:hypothetical protein
VTSSAEFYNPSYGYWYSAPSMTIPREQHSATLLEDGDVLVAGGDPSHCCTPTTAAEIYASALLTVSPSSGPVGQSMTLSGSGFYAGEKIRILWDYSPIGFSTTSSTGSFVVHATVPPTTVGPHVLVASGERSGAAAQATFDVTASPRSQ